MLIYRLVFLVTLIMGGLIIPRKANAQLAEAGGSLGIMNYTGDLSKRFELGESSPGASVFYRRNYSEAFSVRYGFTGGQIRASDEKPFDELSENRLAAFDVYVIEMAAIMEYHFLDYKSKYSTINWSPYFTAGVGLFNFFGEADSDEDYSKLQLALPIGVGFKYQLSPNYTIGIEWGARYTSFDYLDNVSEANIDRADFDFGDQHTNDWYHYIGVSLSYGFYIIPCPFKYD